MNKHDVGLHWELSPKKIKENTIKPLETSWEFSKSPFNKIADYKTSKHFLNTNKYLENKVIKEHPTRVIKTITTKTSGNKQKL